MTTRRNLHALSVVLLAALTVGAGAASAAPKPKAKPKKLVASTAKFYMRANGCGATQEEGRLDPKSGSDSSTGCGTIGGAPIDELFYQVDGPAPVDYRTGTKGIPVILDATRKITGSFATMSWIGTVGGVGKVEFDITASGTTTAGKVIQFGEVKVSADASPTGEVTKVPFEIAPAAAAAKQTFKTLVVSVTAHGANVNMNAQRYDGDSFVVFPSYILK